MSTKTAKVLHVIAFILIVLALAFVLVGWLAFKEPLMELVQSSEEMMKAQFTPWGLIIEITFILVLALIWLIVLMNRPGRGTTIAMTVIMGVLLAGYFAVGRPFLIVWLAQTIANRGVDVYAAYNQFDYAAGTIANWAFIPGVVLMILSLGCACGKNFKAQEEEAPVQQPYGQRPMTGQPAMQMGQQGYPQQAGMQRPTMGQTGYPQGYGQQTAAMNQGVRPASSVPGQASSMAAASVAGQRPEGMMQNAGQQPKTEMDPSAMAKPVTGTNVGTAPKTEAAPAPEASQQAPQTLASLNLDHKTGGIPEVSFSKPTETPSAPIIYPWMKAAGAPAKTEETVENAVEALAQEQKADVVEEVLTEAGPEALEKEVLEDLDKAQEEALEAVETEVLEKVEPEMLEQVERQTQYEPLKSEE